MIKFNKKFKILMPIIFGVVFVLSNFLMANNVWAASCGCVLRPYIVSSLDTEIKKACMQVTSIQDCKPLAYGVTNTELASRYDCFAFRDQQCNVAVGNSTKTQYNPCWQKKACEDAKGIWDTENKYSQECGEAINVGGISVERRRCFVKTPDILLQVAIPGVTEKVCSLLNDKDERVRCDTNPNICENGLGECRPAISDGFPGYIKKFAKFFIGMLAVSAVVMVMWGGFKRIIAAGNAERISDSNEAIFGAIIGLVLALISYTLLNLINPKLIENSGINIDKIKEVDLLNWCPERDPLDTSIIYECGDLADVNGQACVGQVCPAGTNTGCTRTSRNKGKSDTGKSLDYECLTPDKICKSLTISALQDVYGVEYSVDSRSGVEKMCEDRSKLDGNTKYYCYWPGGTGCDWITPDNITQKCNSTSTCGDLDNDNWGENNPYCKFDLCNRGCKIFNKHCSNE